MSEVGWGSDHLVPQKKRKIPAWIWGCGGGCMFLIGALIVAAIVAKPHMKRWLESMSEPDKQWPELAEILPFDEPPAGVTIQRVPLFKMWKLEAFADDLFAIVFAPPAENADGPWAEWLTDPKRSPMFANQEGTFDCVEGTLTVQGRELRSVRFTRANLPPDDPAQSTEVAAPTEKMEAAQKLIPELRAQGSGLDLVITKDGSPQVVLIWLVRGRRGETVSDEQALAFLAPFRIGADR